MPRTVLHIDSSIRLDGSTSRDLTKRLVARLAPDRIIRRDLAETLPLIDADWIAANFTPEDERSPAQRAHLALSDRLVEEIEAADTLVIGAPIYNFSIPAGLKAWIDLVARAKRTFRYTEAGPEGLMTGKRAIIVVASGGTRAGSDIDFATGYLRHILGFIGITDVDLVAADQLMIDADAARAEADAALERIAA